MTAFEMGFMDKMAEEDVLPVLGGITGAGIGSGIGARGGWRLMDRLSRPLPGSVFVQKGPGYPWKSLPTAGASGWRIPTLRNPDMTKFKLPAAILGALAVGNLLGRIGYHGVKGIQNSDKQAEADAVVRDTAGGVLRGGILGAGAYGGAHALDKAILRANKLDGIPDFLSGWAANLGPELLGKSAPLPDRLLAHAWRLARKLKSRPGATIGIPAALLGLSAMAGSGKEKAASGTVDPDTMAMADRAPDPGFHKALLKKTPKPAAASPKPVRRPGSGSLLLTR